MDFYIQDEHPAGCVYRNTSRSTLLKCKGFYISLSGGAGKIGRYYGWLSKLVVF